MNVLRFLKNIYGKKIYFQIVFSILLTFGTAVAQFEAAQHLGDVIDAVGKGYEEAVYQFLVISVSTVCYILGTAAFTFWGGKITVAFSRCVQIKIGMKLCSTQYRATEQIDEGSLLTMISKDIDSIKNWLGLLMKSGFLPVCLGFVPVCLFQWCNWKFALFALCLIPLNAAPSVFFARKLFPFHDNEKKAYSKVLSHFIESLRFVMLIKAFGLEQLFLEKHREELDNYWNARKKRMFFEKLTEEYGRCYGHISRILLLLLSAYFIYRGEMTIGRLTSVILCAEFVGEGLKIVGSISLCLPAAKAGIFRIQKLLELPDEAVPQNRIQASMHPFVMQTNILQTDTLQSIALRTGVLPIYEVRKLSFSYGDTTVLHDIDFCVHEGEKIAVVGLSGCGKTTLFKLLSGLYIPKKDHIFFRGTDIAVLSPEYLRNHITATTQEAFLFQATFEDNIKVAKSSGSKMEIMTACKKAQLDSFIQTLAHGYNTEINTTIQSISNGQMQRINLARAFLRNTNIFLLDEPTSALDPDTAGAIWNELFANSADKTLLVILHDLEEVYRFHKVLVLDNGKIVAFGTHTELIQSCELYRKLYEEKMMNRRGRVR